MALDLDKVLALVKAMNEEGVGRLRAVLGWVRLAEPLNMPRGVRKFRTIEEMVAERERYEQERADRLRAGRLRK